MSNSPEEVIATLKEKRKNLTYNKLVALMQSVGCDVRGTKDGSLVSHAAVPGFKANVPRPHGRSANKHVLPVYVKGCIELLDRLGALEAE